MSGKGSAPRPFSVSNEEYANRWDAIFGKDKPKEEAWEQLELPFYKECPHDVWTHDGDVYRCLDCGQPSKEGPYVSR